MTNPKSVIFKDIILLILNQPDVKLDMLKSNLTGDLFALHKIVHIPQKEIWGASEIWSDVIICVIP